MQLVQLSRTDHSSLLVDPALAGAAAANVHLVPLVRSELRRACASCPVLFAKDSDTGQFYLAALMGLEPHENLYWNGERLETDFVPLNLLRLPFYVGGDDGGGGVLCVDLHSPGTGASGGLPIIGEDGNDSPYLRSIQAILTELATQREPTRAFVDMAAAYKLITEVKLDIRFDDGSDTVLTGFYGIDEVALAREAAGIVNFDDVIAMAAMIVSVEHIGGLVRRRNARTTREAAWLSSGN